VDSLDINLKKKLKEVHDRFHGEVSIILEFLEQVTKSMKLKEVDLKRSVSDLSTEDRNDLRGFYAMMIELVMPTEKTNVVSRTFRPKSERVFSTIMWHIKQFKYKKLLAEMALAYVLASFEVFIKEILHQVFTANKNILKTKNRVITYDELFMHDSFEKLVSHIATKEVELLGYLSVDDIDKSFESKFKINLSSYDGWKVIREAVYRRNLIMHNGGVTNGIYCKATGYKKMGETLDTDIIYVKHVTQKLLKFIDFLHDGMIKKLKLV
jgi:hypothetical protein